MGMKAEYDKGHFRLIPPMNWIKAGNTYFVPIDKTHTKGPQLELAKLADKFLIAIYSPANRNLLATSLKRLEKSSWKGEAQKERENIRRKFQRVAGYEYELSKSPTPFALAEALSDGKGKLAKSIAPQVLSLAELMATALTPGEIKRLGMHSKSSNKEKVLASDLADAGYCQLARAYSYDGGFW